MDMLPLLGMKDVEEAHLVGKRWPEEMTTPEGAARGAAPGGGGCGSQGLWLGHGRPCEGK